MEEAALIIAVVALILALVVAGFGIVLQMLIYRASTDQLLNIGKESASLSASIAMSLGRIHETTATTQVAVSRQLEQVTERLLDGFLEDRQRPIPVSEAAEVPEGPVEPPEAEWAIQRTIKEASTYSIVKLVLTFLDGEDDGKSHKDIRERLASDYEEGAELPSLSAGLDFFYVLGTLMALNAIEHEGDKLVLTNTGKQAVLGLTRL